jgi:rhamnosyltransferase
MRILAGMILYNPDINRLEKAIESIIYQVDGFILFNNQSKNTSQIEKIIQKYSEILLINSSENVGVATGLNTIIDRGVKESFDWFLALDQDSISPCDIVRQFMQYVQIRNVAIICPQVVDKRQMYKYYFEETKRKGITEVSQCITAGSMINIQICKNIGKFEDRLFIDFVDFEFCKRIVLNNYKIIRVNSVILDQELGDIVHSKHYDLFIKLGKKFNSRLLMRMAIRRSFPPFRRFYVARNHTYYLRKYKKYCHVYKELGASICALIKLLIFCPHKIKLIIATIRGVKEGLKMNVVPYKPTIKK